MMKTQQLQKQTTINKRRRKTKNLWIGCASSVAGVEAADGPRGGREAHAGVLGGGVVAEGRGCVAEGGDPRGREGKEAAERAVEDEALEERVRERRELAARGGHGVLQAQRVQQLRAHDEAAHEAPALERARAVDALHRRERQRKACRRARAVGSGAAPASMRAPACHDTPHRHKEHPVVGHKHRPAHRGAPGHGHACACRGHRGPNRHVDVVNLLQHCFHLFPGKQVLWAFNFFLFKW